MARTTGVYTGGASASTPQEIAALVFLHFLHHHWRFATRTRQSVFSVRIRSAQSQAAVRAGHLDRKMTCDDVSRDVPALHIRRTLTPRTYDHLAIAREIVHVPKVIRDAPSVSSDKCRTPARPRTLERGLVREIPPFASRSGCGCCMTREFLS